MTAILDLSEYATLKARTINQLDYGCEDIANEGAEAARAHSATQHRFRNRTRVLESSIKTELAQQVGPRIWDAVVKATAPYAAHVEWDTRPHVIRARRAPFLSFWWEKMGVWFRGKKVNHPGTSGTWFMSLGARKGYYTMLDSAKKLEERIARIWG